MQKDVVFYLTEIINSIKSIEHYTRDIDFDYFDLEQIVVDACLMQFHYIGELAKKIKKLNNYSKDLPLQQMIGLRNLISHEYQNINVEIIRTTIKNDIPQLKKIVKKEIERFK